ncbi:MAG: hypothetical protein AAFV53_30410 [Myxococcota bacterium]
MHPFLPAPSLSVLAMLAGCDIQVDAVRDEIAALRGDSVALDAGLAAVELSLKTIQTDDLTGASLEGYATEAQMTSLSSRVSDIEADMVSAGTGDFGVSDLMTYVSVDTVNHEIYFTGANIHIQSGAGASVLGGTENTASGDGSTVYGGEEETATGAFSYAS